MTLWIDGEPFSDNLFDNLADMDERHDWEEYHESYQKNKHQWRQTSAESEQECRNECRQAVFQQATYISEPTITNIGTGQAFINRETGKHLANSVLTCVKMGIQALKESRMNGRNLGGFR